jgi:hypothetical protein
MLRLRERKEAYDTLIEKTHEMIFNILKDLTDNREVIFQEVPKDLYDRPRYEQGDYLKSLNLNNKEFFLMSSYNQYQRTTINEYILSLKIEYDKLFERDDVIIETFRDYDHLNIHSFNFGAINSKIPITLEYYCRKLPITLLFKIEELLSNTIDGKKLLLYQM